MLKTYFKRAICDLNESKGFSVINIIGLAIGLATFLPVILHVSEELPVINIIKKLTRFIVLMLTCNLVTLILLLVVIAFFISSPIAFYLMNRWLQSFAYRIHISWWIFLIAGITAILIALLTVSFQAIKAALANPVDSLRSE